MDYSPYEIVGNNVLPFSDIIKIKQVEDVLEKYWNDHRMDTTIEYMVTNTFPSPFDFFQDFGTFWDKQGWARIGHQLEDLFRRLNHFLTASKVKDLDVINGLMKYDYLVKHKFKPRKPWWEASLEKKNRNELYQQILETPALLGPEFITLNLDEKELYKHTMLEELSFHLTHYLKTGTIEKGPYGLLAYFSPSGNETLIFSFDVKKPVY
jgi:hypothetical protein